MRIEVLGPVRLVTDARDPVDVPERQLRLLLASLVAANGEPVSADALIDRLWSDTLPANPRKVLRAKLSRLRTVLDEAKPGARDLLTHQAGGYRLTGNSEITDAARFRDAIEHARRMQHSRRRVEVLTEAVGLWRGEPYGDVAEEVWLAPTVAQLKELRGDAVEMVVETLVRQGAPEEAISYAGGVADDYAMREGLIGALMLALYQAGRQQEALATFESLRHRLATDLGVDPGPRIRELHGRILRQEPALERQEPETATPSGTRRSNLPAETTSLIGRRREVAQTTALLGRSRLVTLTGIGGVGKTRLALHVAREQAERFERGVWFIDLTQLSATAGQQFGSGERIAALVVDALELPVQTTDEGALARLREALGARSALLVLDNCEHVADEAAALAGELLRHVPGVRLLATSREPLGLPEEQRYDVPALSTEPPADGGASTAMELFVARARAGDPTFSLDDGAFDAVAELCRRLDGLPLALELAAGRIRGLPVPELLHRLNDRLNLLRRPGRAMPRRQQTLRGMIDWSWSLLSGPEQVVLRRLAVHPGTVSLAAAEAICADEPDEQLLERASTADLLTGLVDRSMVTTVPAETGMRYGLLESIAAYAAEKLDEAGERAAVTRRHLRYHLDLAREADRHLRGPRQRRWLTELEAERHQLRHAFDAAVNAGDGGSAAALAVRTFWYQWIAGHQSNLEHDLTVATALPGPRDDTHAAAATLAACLSVHRQPGQEARRVEEALGLFHDDVARAQVQWFAGASLLAVGVREAGEKHIEEAIAILHARGFEWDVAVAASQRDWFAVSMWGAEPWGLPDGRDPETVLRAVGDGYGLSQVFGVQHRIAELNGQHARAAAAAERALDICLDLDLRVEASYWLSATAVAAVHSGDVTLAEERLAAARSISSDIADAHGLQFADFAEANVARFTGDPATARILLDRWLTGAGPTASHDSATHFERGFLAVHEGDTAQAEDAFHRLGALLVPVTDVPATARLLELGAAIHLLRDEAEVAAGLLGAAAALRTRVGIEPSAPEREDIDRVRAGVHERLPEQRAAAAFRRGEACEPASQLDAVIGPLVSAGRP
ncbi:putative ATPase/DNA-binding SARP family transcriptional activator [Prauserella sediminis]|uniref:Putative ATPase/DNA-binding SARP family transcriptional activator n=1 Tax=Prauserella sediminis TaxID=577680 RepID=A0A839XRZ8_9PSEU|nr:BTAD domain-containing putative transcriptional regulator [Prauserella sediminis]MBB3663728.1 putative ATPase/DNA-binding SARP family transcriptional activator [Prauserella sediminis]